MIQDREIQYTDAAKEKLAQAKAEYVKLLENAILETKYVPGDELVEVTASDVERASRRFRLRSGGPSRVFLPMVMLSMGLAIAGSLAATVASGLTRSGNTMTFIIAVGGMVLALSALLMLGMIIRRPSHLYAPDRMRESAVLELPREERERRERVVRMLTEQEAMLAERLEQLVEKSVRRIIKERQGAAD